MPRKKSSAEKIQLESYESLFGIKDSSWVQNELKCEFQVYDLPIEELHDSKDHPFKVVDDEKMQELTDSIKQYGVIHPGIARPREEGGYELIAGHRRKFASQKLGYKTMPVIVLKLNDDDAAILMVQSNFCQREELLPSEKARGYRREFDARKHQGNKGGYTADKLGESTGDSKSTVKRFIKLSYLSDELLDLLDEKKLGLEQGYDIAFLNEEQQTLVYTAIMDFHVNMSTEQSGRIKEFGIKNELTYPMVQLILTEKKPKPRKFVMKADRLADYFSDEYSAEQIEDIIYGLLDQWKGGK